MKFKQLYFALVAVAFYLSMPAYAQTYAIRDARIVTVSGPVIEKGTIVIRDGLIEAVGPEARIPADAKIFEGSGLTVYPGFIDSLTNLGLPTPTPRPTPSGPSGFPLPLAAAAATSSQPSNSNYPAGLRPEELVIDELRAGDAQFESNRNAGFTTALTTGRSGIFNGQSALINLAGESVSAMTIKSPVAVHITFATIPGAYPGSLLGTFAALRQMFNDAKRLDEWKRLYAANPKGIKRPDADRSLEALIPVVKGEIPVVFVANRRNEVVRALDLAKEYNLKAVIAGGQEAGIFADRLKSQAVPVLLSLNYPKRTTAASPEADPEGLETLRFRAEAPKTPAKLAAAGVKFAFFSGGLTNLNDLFSNIRKSTENGLSRDAAIRALTLSA
ncbi:MAG: amidohydrolase, partial [Blastocatellia bacterium]